MKRRNLLLFPVLGVLALTTLFSCGQDRWAEYYPLTGRDLWIDDIMRQDYLWYEDIPSPKKLNYFQEPSTFLKSILSSKDKGFSTVDTLDNTPVPSYGFDYTLYKLATSDTVYNALISYVVPGSPAAEAELKRGEWIMLVDGDSITKKREKLLTEGGARQLLIGKYQIVKDEENEEDKGTGGVQSDREVNLPAARVVTDNAIHKTALIQLNGTYQVGYLAYNSFTPGPTDDSQEYNNALRQFSQSCQQAGVDNFVLDLRYNAGGEMECVQLLADLLVPTDKLDSPFAFLQYNDKQSAKNRDLILDAQLLQGGVNLNLPKVYIITSGTTAGAAEMLINCLKPYMTVVLVGQTTKGENVATASYLNPDYPYVLRPVVCEVFNSEGEAEYANGFTPDYSVNESSYLQSFLPLGDPKETLFNVALNLIAGKTDEPETTTRMTAVKNVQMKRNFRKGLIVK